MIINSAYPNKLKYFICKSEKNVVNKTFQIVKIDFYHHQLGFYGIAGLNLFELFFKRIQIFKIFQLMHTIYHCFKRCLNYV